MTHRECNWCKMRLKWWQLRNCARCERGKRDAVVGMMYATAPCVYGANEGRTREEVIMADARRALDRWKAMNPNTFDTGPYGFGTELAARRATDEALDRFIREAMANHSNWLAHLRYGYRGGRLR